MNRIKADALALKAREAARILRQYYEALHETEKTCPICGTRFTGIDTQVYCSHKCRRRAHYYRQRIKKGKYVPIQLYDLRLWS